MACGRQDYVSVFLCTVHRKGAVAQSIDNPLFPLFFLLLFRRTRSIERSRGLAPSLQGCYLAARLQESTVPSLCGLLAPSCF